MMKTVNVIKSNYIPRDRLTSGRFNIVLNITLSVDQSSYLFSGSFPTVSEKSKRLMEDFERITNLMRKGIVNLREIKRFCSRLEREKGGRTPPKDFPILAGRHIIPGSAIKGAVRSRIEYKLAPFKENGELRSYSCYIIYDPRGTPGKRHLKFWGEDVALSRETCNPPLVCMVCDLFGCQNLSSRISFSDGIMVHGEVEKLNDLGIQAATPGSKFKSKIAVHNANLLDLSLLFLGLELFTGSPILLGFYKYRFNKAAGGEPYRGKYFFGLLRISLDDFSFPQIHYTPLPKDVAEIKDPRILIEMAKSELDRKIGNFVKIEKGVIG